MIDTIVATIDTKDADGVFRNLKSEKEIKKPDQIGVEHKGMFRNMNVTVTTNSKTQLRNITIIGSLSTFINGNNLKRISRADIKLGIEEIEDLLSIPFKNAWIKRIDLGCNMLMRNPVQDYLMSLDRLSHYRKSIINDYETVYFKTTKKELAFYDKGREFKSKSNLPLILFSNHILRYELRFRSKIAKELKVGPTDILASDLYNQDFYDHLLYYFMNYYLEITKITETTIKDKPDVRRFKHFLGKHGINRLGGHHNVSIIIDSLSKRFNLSSTAKSRINKGVKEIVNDKSLIDDSMDLIKELDAKIMRAVEFAL